jgi:hypothetical protein
LEWHVGPSAIFPVCQGHNGNVLLVVAIWFPETRKNVEETNQANRQIRRAWDHRHIFGGQNCCTDKEMHTYILTQ